MAEFSLVDQGSLLFEMASGCILHRDPASGKVKFLPLGRWKGTMTIEDLPVKYIALSDPLDMVGVQLMATLTRYFYYNAEKGEWAPWNAPGGPSAEAEPDNSMLSPIIAC